MCPCGNKLEYAACCEPFITGKKNAPTAEALMRSRYTAFVKGAEPYIKNTLAPEARADYNEKEVREWSREAEWVGLEILSAKTDTVEFVAKYKTKGKILEHHEVAKFRKDGDRWYFVDGDAHVHEEGKGHQHKHEPIAPIVRESPKIGRNDPCSCGSGKKYKKCCAA
jgi:SEC-C motif-containing protein